MIGLPDLNVGAISLWRRLTNRRAHDQRPSTLIQA
jgi:hypothetical protein